MTRLVSLALLLLAAPLFSQSLPAAADPETGGRDFRWFELTETKAQVSALLGHPALAAPLNAEFEAWQFQLGDTADEDFSHYLVFRKADGRLVSVARNYDPERNVDLFFPASESSVFTIDGEGSRPFSVRVRRLSGGRILMAMGIARPGQNTGQIVLIHESALRVFYPALYGKMHSR